METVPPRTCSPRTNHSDWRHRLTVVQAVCNKWSKLCKIVAVLPLAHTLASTATILRTILV